MNRLIPALVAFALGLIIEAAGYRAPLEEMVDGALISVQQIQTAGFILVLRMVFVVIPVVLLVFGAYHAYKYPLSPGLHTRLKDYLAARREGGKDDVEEEALDAALTGRTAILDGRHS